MANWAKLNKEFDDVIDNMTDEDWKRWHQLVKARENRIRVKPGDQVIVTDIKHKSFYMKRMFVLWISKDSFYCLGSTPDQDVSECYMGLSQIRLAN